jgi:hypothetical protein
MDTAVSVELFVEILNRYVYYFDQQNEAVSVANEAPISLLMKTGHYQVSQWPHRTDPLKLANESRISHYRYA